MKKIILGLMVFSCFIGFEAFCSPKMKKIHNGDEISLIQESERNELNKIKRQRHVRVDWNRELKLNDEQEYMVKVIYQESHEKIKELLAEMKALHQKIEDIYNEDDEKIYNILNDKQKIQYEKIKRQNLRNRGQKPTGKKSSRKKMRPTDI